MARAYLHGNAVLLATVTSPEGRGVRLYHSSGTGHDRWVLEWREAGGEVANRSATTRRVRAQDWAADLWTYGTRNGFTHVVDHAELLKELTSNG